MFHYAYIVSALAVLSVVLGHPQWQNSDAERMRILGPLAPTARGVSCSGVLTPSSTIPSSVHALRPADIKHVGAMGDSLTAANGAKAFSIIAVLVEYRGVSWSIGGDDNLDKVVTLPNILRKCNPQLFGYSKGSGNRNSSGAGFNVAKAGAISKDMPSQAVLLVDRIKRALGANFAYDWKLVTFFIGGNDLCVYCKDTKLYSADNYVGNIRTALDYLHANMPRTLVNFVTVLNVAELDDLHEGLTCQSLQNIICDCSTNKKTREITRQANINYQSGTNQLIDSGRYDTKDDFTVVRQPFMEHMKVPLTADGKSDFSYFSPDCFHFSQKGHEAAAVELWNNMMQKVGEKSTSWNMAGKINYPTSNEGYIYTSKNSH